MKWIKASERQPEFEVVTLQQLINYGLNNGANIVNGMPWSFNYKGIPVTHENDGCYIVGFGIYCRKDNPVVLFNDEAYNYWRSELKIFIKHNGKKRILICAEGSWSFYRDGHGSFVRVDADYWKDIEWLDESEDQETSAIRAENERLRGLIKQMWYEEVGKYFDNISEKDHWYEQFETENNL